MTVLFIDRAPIHRRTIQNHGDCLAGVTHVTVNDCFKSEPAETVTAFLERLPDDRLKLLFMENAPLNDDGADALAARAGGLTRLCINGCTKNEAHTTLILCALPKDGTLLKLFIANCPVNEDGARELTEIVPGLDVLNVTGTGIMPSTYPPLVAALWEMRQRGGDVGCDFDLAKAELWRKGNELRANADPAQQALLKSLDEKFNTLADRHAFSDEEAERILKTLEWAETMQQKFADAGQINRLQQLSGMSVDQYENLMKLSQDVDTLKSTFARVMHQDIDERHQHVFKEAIEGIVADENTLRMAQEFFCHFYWAIISCLELSHSATSGMFKVGVEKFEEKAQHFFWESMGTVGGATLDAGLAMVSMEENSALSFDNKLNPIFAAAIGAILTVLCTMKQEHADAAYETKRSAEAFGGFAKVIRMDKSNSFARVPPVAKDFAAGLSACFMLDTFFPGAIYGYDTLGHRVMPGNRETAIKMLHKYLAASTDAIVFQRFNDVNVEAAVTWITGYVLKNDAHATLLYEKIKIALTQASESKVRLYQSDLQRFETQKIVPIHSQLSVLRDDNAKLRQQVESLYAMIEELGDKANAPLDSLAVDPKHLALANEAKAERERRQAKQNTQ
ncbi:MAG: hypothetical protein ABW189_08540 [Rickettsiales bacterium]